MQALRIVRRHGLPDRRTVTRRTAPSLDKRLAVKNTEIADPIEGVEVAEDRTVNGIDEGKAAASEPWPAPPGAARQFSLNTVEHCRQRAGFGEEAGLARR